MTTWGGDGMLLLTAEHYNTNAWVRSAPTAPTKSAGDGVEASRDKAGGGLAATAGKIPRLELR